MLALADMAGAPNAEYNVAQLLRLTGPLSDVALQAALDAMGRRHEALRTTYPRGAGGHHVAAVMAPGSFSWPLEVQTLQQPASGACALQDPAILAVLRGAAAAPFALDSTAAPLVRALLLHLGGGGSGGEGTAAGEHLLLVTMHHIISDGASVPIMKRDLVSAYSALVAGTPVEAVLPGAAPQVGAVAYEQQAWRASSNYDRELSHWKGQLCGVAPLQLPIDAPVRPPIKSTRGEAVFGLLERSQLDRLKQQLAPPGSGRSLYTLLIAAFEVLLSRHSAGQRNFALGTAWHGRLWGPACQDTVGYFVNPLALVADLEDEEGGPPQPGAVGGGNCGAGTGRPLSLAKHLERVALTAMDAFNHSSVPFAAVVDAMALPRDLSATPLFQVLLVLQDALSGPADMGSGLAMVQEPMPMVLASKFDLELEAVEAPEGLRLRLAYCPDLFDRRTAQRMAGHYTALLSSMAAVEDASAVSVWELDMLPPPERALLLDTLGCAPSAAAALAAPAAKQAPLVHQQFEAWAARQPDAPALAHWGGGRLAYGQLNTQADVLAAHLRRLGVGPEVMVAVFQERSLLFTTAQLAALKAGGAFVPMDPATPEARVRDMLEDMAPRVVLTTRQHVASGAWPAGAAPAGVAVVCMDELQLGGAAGAAVAAEAPPAGWQPAGRDNLAYCIFTSGTTGRPKGVLVQHGGFAQVSLVNARILGTNPGDRVFQFLAPVFDGSLIETFGALCSGAELLLWTPPDFMTPVRELKATHAVLTPTALSAIAPGSLPHLRVLLTGGEALPLALAQAWKPHVERVINQYGPTETTIACTVHQWTGSEPVTSVTLGGALPGYSLYVLDDSRRLAPAGAVGTLWIGGTGTARGYLNRPELTAERFVADPFVAGGRMYNSGDLARWTAQGELAYCGRADKQVKIRGYRIELGEVASVLAGVGGVRASAAVVLTDSAGNLQIVGYVAPTGLDEAPMRAALVAALPSYMQPAAIVQLDALPRTRNGKVDEAALPQPTWPTGTPGSGDGAAGAMPHEAPAPGLESGLADIWRDVLGLDSIGAHDDFWRVGGNSLLAGVVVSRVRQDMGAELLPATAIYTAPTVRTMAVEIRAACPGTANPECGSSGAGAAPPTAADGDAKLCCDIPVAGAKVYSATLPWVLSMQLLAALLAYVLRYAALVPVLILVISIGNLWGLSAALALTGPVVAAAFGSAALLSIAVRWLLLFGRLRPGNHPLWGPYYLRWWAAHNVMGAADAVMTVVCGSPLHKLLLRAMGAHIGAGAHIDTCRISEPDLVWIGAGAVLETDSHLQPASLQPGHVLSVGRVRIAPGAHLAQRCLVQGGCSVAGRVEPMATVTGDSQELREVRVFATAAGSACAGEDAWSAKAPSAAASAGCPPPTLHLLAACLVALLHGYAFAPCAAAVYYLYVAIQPFHVVGSTISHDHGPGRAWLQFLLCLIAVWRLLLPLSFYTLVLLAKHTVLGRPRMLPDGRPDLTTSWAVLRHWMMGRLMDSPLMAAALLICPGTEASSCLLRALGARIGLRVLVEHPRCFEPDLLVLGHDSEMGGDVLIEWGITLQPFAGATHGVVAEPGCTVSSGAIVGDYSVLPPGTLVPGGEIWVGAPCARLLRRNLGAETLLAVADAMEHRGSRRWRARSPAGGNGITGSLDVPRPAHLKAQAGPGGAPLGVTAASAAEDMRAAITAARRRYVWCQASIILACLMGTLAFPVPYAVLIWAVRKLFWQLPGQLVLTYFAALPVLALAGSVLQGLLLVVLKWACTGRMQPGDYEFYGSRHTRWLTYASAVMLQGRENIEMWTGSAIYSLYWRALGAKVGRLDRICLYARLQPDIDMCSIGSGAIVADGALVQGHTVENHTLSQAPIDIGPGAWMGTCASLLPGASLHARAQLAPLSLMLKGEAASAGMRWAGIPAAPQRRVAAAATAEESARQAALQEELVQLSMSMAGTAALLHVPSHLRPGAAPSVSRGRSHAHAMRQASLRQVSLRRQATLGRSGSMTVRAAMARAASGELPV